MRGFFSVLNCVNQRKDVSQKKLPNINKWHFEARVFQLITLYTDFKSCREFYCDKQIAVQKLTITGKFYRLYANAPQAHAVVHVAKITQLDVSAGRGFFKGEWIWLQKGIGRITSGLDETR